jgi:hypothetical protein
VIEHHDEAVAFARNALVEIFPLLPSSGLQWPDWAGQRITVDGRPFYISISPWNEARGGRGFKIWPANSTPAGRPRVDGFVEVSAEGWDIQPDRYDRPRSRRQAVRT